MKKIIFIIHEMVLGGIERSLIDNIKILLSLGCEVTILVRENRGDFKGEIPAEVKVFELPLLPMDRYELNNGRIKTLKHAILCAHWMHAMRMLTLRCRWYFTGKKNDYNFMVVDSVLKRTPKILTEFYDIAVAYFGDSPWSVSIALNYISSKRKICWSHSERAYYQYSKQLYQKYYSKFNLRFACSEASAQRINQAVFPRIKVLKFPHVIDQEMIFAKAKQGPGFTDDDTSIRVLSCGRLSQQKGFDIAIRVHKKLLDIGIEHRWYFLGNGEEETTLRTMIQNLHLEKTCFLLGGKQNPYPFFAECDIYAQPSRYEGFCLTLAEAKLFKKPIVCTDFDGAQEQLENGKTGLIVPENNEEAFFNAMQKILTNNELAAKFHHALQKQPLNNSVEVIREKWETVIEDIK